MTFSLSLKPGALTETLMAARELGFDCVDLSAWHQLDLCLVARQPREEAARVRQELKRAQLDLSEVFTLHFGDPINHPNPAKREQSRTLFEGLATFCQYVGAESIMMSPGLVHQELGEEASILLAIEELRFMQGVCEGKGLQLNIEPHSHSLAEDPGVVPRFCKAVPGLGLTLDYSHFVFQGYDQSAVEPLHKYATHFHARQARPGFTNASRAEGTIDFRRIIHKLKADSWDGVICLEYNPSLIDDAPGEIAWLKRRLEKYLGETWSGIAATP
jgi:sugar phosphate isomerase/epimerase